MNSGTRETEPISSSIRRIGLVRASVQRAVEGRRRAGERRIGIDVRTADVPHRCRAAVLLVIGVEYEQHIERPCQHRVRVVSFSSVILNSMFREVSRKAQLVVRIHMRAADAVAERIRGDARDLGDQSVGLPRA